MCFSEARADSTSPVNPSAKYSKILTKLYKAFPKTQMLILSKVWRQDFSAVEKFRDARFVLILH